MNNPGLLLTMTLNHLVGSQGSPPPLARLLWNSPQFEKETNGLLFVWWRNLVAPDILASWHSSKVNILKRSTRLDPHTLRVRSKEPDRWMWSMFGSETEWCISVVPMISLSIVIHRLNYFFLRGFFRWIIGLDWMRLLSSSHLQRLVPAIYHDILIASFPSFLSFLLFSHS